MIPTMMRARCFRVYGSRTEKKQATWVEQTVRGEELCKRGYEGEKEAE